MVFQYFSKFALDVYAKRKNLRQVKKITRNVKICTQNPFQGNFVFFKFAFDA